MKTVAIIQARMGSSRLPGKVLKPLAGRAALFHVVDRLRHSRRIDDIVVATTSGPEDDAIEEFCTAHEIECFRGSAQDVLDRYYRAAVHYNADPIVRITADCPVIDPMVVDEVLDGYFAGAYDLYSLGGEFPDGLDVAVFSFNALETAWREASLPSEREHVCPFMAKNPERFRIGSLEKFRGLAHHRWTLDEDADYRLLRLIFDRLYAHGGLFLTEDILHLFEREPKLAQINGDIVRNEGYLKSLEEDREFLAGQSISGC